MEKDKQATTRFWTGGIAVLTLLGSGILYGCEHSETGEAGEGHGEGGKTQTSSAGGESGESGDSSVDLATDDIAYLTQLWTVRGHIEIAHRLYQIKDESGAAHHSQHPEHEIMPRLQPAMDARHAPRLSLEVYEGAIAGHDATKESAAFKELTAEIERASTAITSLALAKGKVIAELSRRAAKEYDIGVDGNTIVNREEFQDGYGFTRAIDILTASLPANEENKVTIDKLRSELAGIEPAWSSLSGGSTTLITDSQFAGRMAKIEISTGGIKE